MKNIWVPLSGAIAQQRNVDTIANNVANANTPGFKRDQLVFKEHLTALTSGVDQIDLPNQEWSPNDFYHSQGAESAAVSIDGNYTDFAQGQLRPTQNPFDLAISGDGFFEVLAPNGIRFSRRGTFTVNAEGTLVNDQGYPVLSKLTPEQITSGSAPRPTDRTIQIGANGQVSVTFDGSIYQQGQKIGEVSVTEFVDKNALRKEGAGLYINPEPANLSPKVSSSIRQGFVEESNVNAVSEMSSLIKATRHFESIQKAMKAYDNIAQKGVNEIAKF